MFTHWDRSSSSRFTWGNKAYVVGRSCVHPHPDIKMGHLQCFPCLASATLMTLALPQWLYTPLMFFNDGVSWHPWTWTTLLVSLLWVSHSVGERTATKRRCPQKRELLCQHLSKGEAMTQWLPLGSPRCRSEKQKTGLLSAKAESITQPFSQVPLKCWHH